MVMMSSLVALHTDTGFSNATTDKQIAKNVQLALKKGIHVYIVHLHVGAPKCLVNHF